MPSIWETLRSYLPAPEEESVQAYQPGFESLLMPRYSREAMARASETRPVAPGSYIAGQVGGTNVAGGVPGPRYGSLTDPLESVYMSFGGRGLRKAIGLGEQPSAPRAVGDSLADLAAKGQIDRPWPGIYKGAISEGRTQPLSYAKPKTFELPEASDELAQLMEQVGGKYKGPISGGAPKPDWRAKYEGLSEAAMQRYQEMIGGPEWHTLTPTQKHQRRKLADQFLERMQQIRQQSQKLTKPISGGAPEPPVQSMLGTLPAKAGPPTQWLDRLVERMRKNLK